VKQLESFPALPLIAPFVIYLVGSAWLAKLPTNWYWIGYACVATASLAVLLWLLSPDRRNKLIQLHCRVGPGVATGVIGIALWIGISKLHLEQSVADFLPTWLQPGERVGFNPWDQLGGGLAIAAFLVVRISGIAIVVPLVEELFWRGFLLRWTIDPDWEKVPIGAFTWQSCLMVTALFTLAHPEWLAAATYCLLVNGLLYWKKDLWQCVVAHAISNLLLAFYVLATDNWWLW
jgi:CAAX prenyl protease-like protein